MNFFQPVEKKFPILVNEFFANGISFDLNLYPVKINAPAVIRPNSHFFHAGGFAILSFFDGLNSSTFGCSNPITLGGLPIIGVTGPGFPTYLGSCPRTYAGASKSNTPLCASKSKLFAQPIPIVPPFSFTLIYIKNIFAEKLLFHVLFVKFCNMKGILKENKYLIILWVLCISGLIFFCGHYSGILIDFGREVYYPERILEGKVLYKDLFNIYGPLAYQINAILYAIFGAKLSTLYGAGYFCSILAVSGIYLITQKFLSKYLSFCVGIFTISICVMTTSIFNFHFPYSWAVLYGLIAFLFSLYFLLNFNESKKSSDLCISSLLAGICITCKYDFLLYTLIILFFIIKEKNWKAFLSFLAAPFLSFGILFIQGLSINDLINSLSITGAMAKSKTLTYFYQNSGIYFHPKAIPTDFVLFLKTAIPFSVILFGAYLFKKNKLASIFLSIAGYAGYLWFFRENVRTFFGFLPLLLLISALAAFRKIDSKLAILILSALAVSAKVFWVMLLNSYGNYYIPIVITALLALMFKFVPRNLEKTAGIYLAIASIMYIGVNNSILELTDSKIQTPKGAIYTAKYMGESTNQLIEFIQKNTKPDDKIVIFPEGMTVNFLADRKSDDFYNSLLPLYIETFGEEKIINNYRKNPPEYIIFNNLNMKDYYFKYICQDYALNFCGFVKENYTPQKIIDTGFRYLIFKHK